MIHSFSPPKSTPIALLETTPFLTQGDKKGCQVRVSGDTRSPLSGNWGRAGDRSTSGQTLVRHGLDRTGPSAATAGDDQIRGDWAAPAFMVGCSSWPLHHRLKLPARRGETGPEPSHPRSAISSPSHKLQRRGASGRAICCPSTKATSRRWQSEVYPRTWGSFLKQCHSPLALRQNSLSVNPSGVASIGSEYTQAITKCLIRAGAGRVARQRACMSRTGTYGTRPQRDKTESPYQGDLQPHRLRSG